MHCTLYSAGPQGRPASDPLSQMDKLRHTGFTTSQKSTRLDMRREARGCTLHYNSSPHTCNPGSTHLSYWMLHQRQGPAAGIRGDTWTGQGCWADLLGTLWGTDTRQGQPRAAGHPSASFSCPSQRPPHTAPAQTLRTVDGNFYPSITLL